MIVLKKIQSSQAIEFLLLSFIFITYLVINILTASRSPTVWMDEVMYTDPAANLYFGNGFTSTAWYAQTADQFWAGNVPIHQFFLHYWIRIFGFSPTAVRSINYIYMIIISIVIWLTTIRLNLIKKSLLRLSLIILILTGYGITFSYRSGRTDTICILLFSCLFLCYSIKNKFFRYITLSMISILFPFAGLQLVVFSLTIGITLLCFLRKTLIKEFLIVQLSSLLGLLMLMALYHKQGVLKSFFASVAPHSFLVSQVVNHSDITKNAIDDSNKFSILDFLFNRLGLLTADYSSVLIFTCLLVIIGYLIYQKKFEFKSSLFFGVIQILIVSVVFSFLGKTPVYYTWMIYITAIVSLLITLDQLPYKFNSDKVSNIFSLPKFVLIPVIIILISSSLIGLPARMLLTFSQWSQRDYTQIESFVLNSVADDDVVYSEFQSYYPVKTKSKQIFLPTYLKIMSSSEKDSISALIIAPESFKEISKIVGGKWQVKNSLKSLTLSKIGAQGYNLEVFKRS
jgi:hypothetical protein